MRADEAAGRTGSPMLHEGNIVRAGGTSDSTLVVINQIQPVYVSFTVPQQQLPAIRRYMRRTHSSGSEMSAAIAVA